MQHFGGEDPLISVQKWISLIGFSWLLWARGWAPKCITIALGCADIIPSTSKCSQASRRSQEAGSTVWQLALQAQQRSFPSTIQLLLNRALLITSRLPADLGIHLPLACRSLHISGGYILTLILTKLLIQVTLRWCAPFPFFFFAYVY